MQDPHLARIKKEMGYEGGKPIIQFYDHAILDTEATKESGRNRYKALVYLRKTPTAPDLVVRDTFSRKATEQDKRDHPEEWAKYCQRKEAIANLDPLLTAVPGMDVAAQFELRDLGIFTCKQLVEYAGDLDGLEELRDIATRILDVAEDVRARRQPVIEQRGNVVTIKPQPVIQNFHYEFTV